jgi:hypothetical protein
MGLVVMQVRGQGLPLRVYARGGLHGPVKQLHVYLDGDGTPWLGPGLPAADPTPRNPLVLELMRLDPAPAIYLARPCYSGLGPVPPCGPWRWTHGRYSTLVVESLADALNAVAARWQAEQVALIGYSGGGTLAMLVAPRVPRVRLVATLAADMDVEAWGILHHYSPLVDSLDPARAPPLPAHILQLHWVGADDANTPPELIRRGLRHQPGARLEVLPGLSHVEGWPGVWPYLLQEIAKVMGATTPMPTRAQAEGLEGSAQARLAR